jgi:2,4-dienoyl-CoA reductase-like NADH-dependent reductase (Old Yellow Enzyme family)
MPKEMTKADIEKVKQAFVDATRRALKVGYDVIEIHSMQPSSVTPRS